MKHKRRPKYLKKYLFYIVVMIALTLVGACLVLLTKAATSSAQFETENGALTGKALTANSNTAANATYTRFGKGISFGGASPGGTYADWYYPGTGLTSLEWTQVPVQDPASSLAADNLLHYYAYTFGVTNHTDEVGYGYAGFQTNGLFKGIFRGKVVNFSFWRSNGGKTSSPGLLNDGNEESSGFQVMYPYNWTVGHKYKFELKPGPSEVDASGKWWGLWVTDLTTNAQTFIGEERIQTVINGKDASFLDTHTGAFGEDLHWWRSLSGNTKYNCSDFQKSSMATINVRANNGAVQPYSFSAFTNSLNTSKHPNNGYETTNCPVSVYTDTNKNVQMNLGYWLPGAPDKLKNP